MRYLVVAIGLATFAAPSAASAHVSVHDGSQRFHTLTCAGVTYDRHWNHTTVPVYLNVSATRGVQRMRKAGAGYWTVREVEQQLSWGLAELNDAVGANVRPFYAGTTEQELVAGAIVVRTSIGRFTGTAQADAQSDCASQGLITSAFIEAHVQRRDGSEIVWGIDNSSGAADIGGLFTHELGHAMGIRHSNDALVFDSQGVRYVPKSVMDQHIGVQWVRHYTRYDRETYIALYGAREGELKAWVSSQLTGGLGERWRAGPPPAPGRAISYRVGKASEGAVWTAYAWSAQHNLRAEAQLYEGSLRGRSAPETISYGPPAVARDTSGVELRMFYLERDQTTQVAVGNINPWRAYAENRKRICWLVSSDGQDWTHGSCLTDPITGATLRTWTDAVNASFDPLRKVYVVTWLEDQFELPDDNRQGRINVMTLPGFGSPQVAPRRVLLAERAMETPSIACRASGAPRCLMVFAARTPMMELTTQRGSIDVTGEWVTHSGYTSSSLPQVQAPSVSYQPWDDRFVVAHLGADLKTTYAQKSSIAAASTWGPLVRVGSASVTSRSAPALGNDQLCLFGCSEPRVVVLSTEYPL